MQRHKPMLYSLQIGRGLAALAVVMQHSVLAAHSLFPAMPATILSLMNLGYLGVDYFFVLSGFIIAHVTHAMSPTTTDAKKYALLRAIRVYTPYLPISLAMTGALTFLPTISLGSREGFSMLASLTLLPSNAPPALSVAWTLQHEIIFYFLFGICFFVFRRATLIYLWALLIAVDKFLDTPAWMHLLTSPINLEFLFGVAACRLYHHGGYQHLRYPTVIVGTALLLVTSTILWHDSIPYLRLLMGAGFACVVFGLVSMEHDHDFSRYRRLVFMGAASYSVYLVHNPCISVLLRVLPTLPHWLPTFIGMMLIATLAGVIYYRLIETALMRYAKQRLV